MPKARGLTLIGVLISLAGGEGLLGFKPLSIPAADIYLESSNQHHSNYSWHAGSLLYGAHAVFWSSLCHVYIVKSECKQCTERKGGVNRQSKQREQTGKVSRPLCNTNPCFHLCEGLYYSARCFKEF